MALVTMPKLSDTMEEGKILRWLKAPGDAVAAGDLLVEVETDKADMEVESPHEGVLSEIRLQEGESGPIGTVIAVIDGGQGEEGKGPRGTPSSAAPASRASTPPSSAAPASRASTPPSSAAPASRASTPPSSAAPPSRASTPRASASSHPPAGSAPPAAEAQPQEAPRGAQQKPASAGARVVQVRPPSRSVGRAPGATPAGAARVPLSSMRASIARRMSESKREAPHFYVDTTVRMDQAVQLRRALKETDDVRAKVTYNHLVLKACADALAAHPELNARFAGDAIEILPEINLGVATAVPEGLIVPVIREADRLSLFALAERARELAEKASRRAFGGDDLSGASFSVSNLGMYDIDGFAAVINPPHAGILAVGSVREQPVVRDGVLAVGHTLRLTLSCDHRAVDGVQAAKFLTDVRARLENPMRLLIERERES